MDRVDSIVNRCYERRGSELWIEGVRAADLAAQYGTPLFAYSQRVIKGNLERLRRVLPPSFQVYYSIKANPARGVVDRLLAEGCGLEVASAGELGTALEAGCAPDRILFAGPGKSMAEIHQSVQSGIGEIHVESLEEIDRIARCAQSLGCVANVAVRVNPAAEARGGAMQMGGKPSPFGIGEEELDAALDRILSRPNELRFTGVHLFVGTQILDHQILLLQYRKGAEIARRAAERAQAPLRTLDFGGGLGIPYFPGEKALDLDAMGNGLREIVESELSSPAFRGTRFLVEPGRFLIGEAGIYMCRVNYVKESRGKRYLVLDGGMHHHLAASGNLGQVIKKNFPMALLAKLGAEPSGRFEVVGPLCTPLDTLGRGVELPQGEVGDLLGVFQSGAYGKTASPVDFLSHAHPSEVIVDGERHVRA